MLYHLLKQTRTLFSCNVSFATEIWGVECPQGAEPEGWVSTGTCNIQELNAGISRKLGTSGRTEILHCEPIESGLLGLNLAQDRSYLW